MPTPKKRAPEAKRRMPIGGGSKAIPAAGLGLQTSWVVNGDGSVDFTVTGPDGALHSRVVPKEEVDKLLDKIALPLSYTEERLK